MFRSAFSMTTMASSTTMTDGEDEPEQGQQVQREAEREHADEGADEGHGDGRDAMTVERKLWRNK